MEAGAELTQTVHNEFNDVFTGLSCFNETFSLQVNEGAKPYQTHLMYMVYVLQKQFKDELDWLQKQQIIVHLGEDDTSEWCKSFVLVSKPNRSV